MKHESGYPVDTQLSGDLAKPVDILFHAVANEYQRIDPFSAALFEGVPEYFFDLGMSTQTADRAHAPFQLRCIAEPGVGMELLKAAVVTELDRQSAQTVSGFEHLRL